MQPIVCIGYGHCYDWAGYADPTAPHACRKEKFLPW